MVSLSGEVGQLIQGEPSPKMQVERHQCPICHQVFGRSEHLVRHSRSHSSERSLKCAYCDKGFYRVDALRRHELVHNQARKTLAKGVRACSACADARRKCSGGETCSGCLKRSLTCDYVKRNQKPPGRSNSQSSGSQARDELAMNIDSPLQESWSKKVFSPTNFRADQQEFPLVNTNPQQENSLGYVSDGQNLATEEGLDTFQPSFATSFISSGPAATNTVTPSIQEIHNDHESPDFWQQSNLNTMNWSFDDYVPTYTSGINDMSFYIQRPPSQAVALGVLGEGNVANPVQTSVPLRVMMESPVDSALADSTANIVSSPCISIDGSQNSGKTNRAATGQYYVDGNGARLPRIRNLLQENPEQSLNTILSIGNTTSPQSIDGYYGFDEDVSNMIQKSDSSQYSRFKLPQRIYDEIHKRFSETCILTSHFQIFQSQFLPPPSVFDYLIHLFFEDFQPTLPFIHVPTFDIGNIHWLLALAMSAVGSLYADTDDKTFSLTMHEFLRRAIFLYSESCDFQQQTQTMIAQVKMLNCIGVMYSGETSSLAKHWHPDLRNFHDEEWPTLVAGVSKTFAYNDTDPTGRWKLWCEAEGIRRTGYCIWLLDSMWGFHFIKRPQLSMEDRKVPLPCQEVLWEADTLLDWDQLHSCAIPSSSMQTALQQIYVEKRLQPSMGEFSRILLIHALFRRTWEVESYFQQPLAQWVPTADRQRASVIPDKESVWLPSIPAYSKWRNSACDCLDVLHWHANSVIGAASGMEHPTVLHLHLARVVLLTPFRDIVKLANLMAEETLHYDPNELLLIRRRVRRWAIEDQYKARLAMIHAGVLFWHVRRYSTSSFSEPPSVLLATLALWAYGTFAEHTQIPESEDEEPSDYPTSMQLDRPADDELVQLFVSRGTRMRANVTGVGNLCSAKGPERVLLEGRKLLAGLRIWGFSRNAVALLTNLARVCQRDSAKNADT